MKQTSELFLDWPNGN